MRAVQSRPADHRSGGTMNPDLLPGELERLEAHRAAHRCAECHREADQHWPACSQADDETRARWALRRELRALRRVRI